MISLKEYYKNRLLYNLVEASSSPDRYELRGSSSRDRDELRGLRAHFEPAIDSTVANIVEPEGKVMGRNFELMAARRAATQNNAFNAAFSPIRYEFTPDRTDAKRWAKTRFVRHEWTPTAEEKAKKETTRRLLNTVHYFSREHGIQLEPKHIEGIDFSDPNFQSHIDTVSSRLGL
jgi:hypothetical protein